MSFSDSYATRTIDLLDQMARDSSTQEVRNWAQQTKLASLTAPMTIATTPNPFVGLLDMVAFVTLRRMVLEEYWMPQVLGEQAAPLLACYKSQEQEIWQIAETLLAPAEIVELKDHIAAWRRENPDQRFVSHVRFSAFARYRSVRLGERGSAPSSVFQLFFIDPLAGADPIATELRHLRQLSERVFFFSERLPILVSLLTQQMLSDAASSPEVDRVLGELQQASDAVTLIAKAADEFPLRAGEQLRLSVAAFSESLASERARFIEDASLALTREREAALGQLEEVIERQRDGLLTAVEQRGPALNDSLSRLDATMVQAKSTSEAMRAAADSIFAMAAQFKGDDDASGSTSAADVQDTFAKLRSTAHSFETAAGELNRLVVGIDQMLVNARDPSGGVTLDHAVDRASRSLSTRLLWTGLALIAALMVARIIAPLIREAMARRMGWRRADF